MEILKLAVILLVIVLVLKIKKSLSLAMFLGAAALIPLYKINLSLSLDIFIETVTSWSTINLLLTIYLITFLQRMMTGRDQLKKAESSLSGLFNNRRVNASLAPIFVGLLPSPGVIFIAGDMINSSVENYLDKDEKTVVTSYYRHISEAFLPTYPAIILACELTDTSPGAFVLGMIPMVIVLIFLGYFFFLRKIPKETGLPPSKDKKRDALNLMKSLWPIFATIFLIIFMNMPVYAAASLIIVLYFILGKFSFKEVKPYFCSAFEPKVMISTFFIMLFKNLMGATGIIDTLPSLFEELPLPPYLALCIIFFLGTFIAGSKAIIAMCMPMAFAAMPGAGLSLMCLLMSTIYASMQISPTHICLHLACEYFKSDYGTLVKKTTPLIIVFYVILLIYYNIWTVLI